MNEFHRRLPPNAMGALERLSSKGTGWWPDLLANWAPSGSRGALRVGIRDDYMNFYMNFYANGQSIAKIEFEKDGPPTRCIHEKYVLPEGVNTEGKKPYIKFRDEEGRDANNRLVCTYGGPKMLKKWIRNSDKYSGPEKRCIASLVEQSPKVIDLEMGLHGVRRRIDLVSLEGASDGIRLVFWEAKMSGNSSLCSSTQEPEPPVFAQLNAYSKYLRDPVRKKEVAEAYPKCCRIICKLHSMASSCVGMSHPIDPLIVAAAEADSLDVDETPRLIVFDDGEKPPAWQEHLEVLRSKVSVAIFDKSSEEKPLESIPRGGG